MMAERGATAMVRWMLDLDISVMMVHHAWGVIIYSTFVAISRETFEPKRESRSQSASQNDEIHSLSYLFRPHLHPVRLDGQTDK
jgi:hypothetical protein